MADIHITRDHSLGFASARKLAFQWAEAAEQKLDMECTYEEGDTSDVVTFKRPGAKGELKVTGDAFVLDAKLGILLGAFRDRIEKAIVENLDELLAHEDPHSAFQTAINQKKQKAEKADKAKPAAKKPAAKKAKG